MRRILIIANYKGPIGGISGQVEELHRHLTEESGYSSAIYSTQGNVIWRVTAFFRLIINSRRHDVLHAHGCSAWGMLPIVYAVIAGKLNRKRVIITYHGGGADEYFAKHVRFVRRWLNRADKIIVLNGYLESVFGKYDMPCEVIPNCIPLSKKGEHGRYQWNAPRFISVRHLRELYNIPCVLQAYAVVKRQQPKATLILLGDGPLRKELEEWVKANKVDDVKFVGQVPNDVMAEYYKESDIMLSAPHVDNMPVSVLEAMNAGVLVISSRVGGVPYLIEEGRTGLLFEDNNVTDLADKMLWAIGQPKESEKMIQGAYEDVKKYSWSKIREQLLPLYEQNR